MALKHAAAQAAGAAQEAGHGGDPWPARRRSWLRPEEWAPWQVIALLVGMVLVLVAAMWATAPRSALVF